MGMAPGAVLPAVQLLSRGEVPDDRPPGVLGGGEGLAVGREAQTGDERAFPTDGLYLAPGGEVPHLDGTAEEPRGEGLAAGGEGQRIDVGAARPRLQEPDLPSGGGVPET